MTKRTPLFEDHLKLGAKMVEFGGWDMPVSYSGIIEEHLAVRNTAGLFDIGHMGLAEVSGVDALPFLQKLATNDASRLATDRAQYSILCNERGGVIDDILIYKLPDKFFVVLNASNTDKDLSWFKKNASPGVKIVHHQDMAALSLQGPKAEALLSGNTGAPIKDMKRNDSREAPVFGIKCLVSRTGYTGGDGFELFLNAKDVSALWRALLEHGRPLGLLPCGLGSRDSLRIEGGLPLYGHEYAEDITPIEAGYGWAVKFEKGDFAGKGALINEKKEGPKKLLVGLTLEDKALPRQGFKVFSDEKLADEIGAVTSGTFSPLLNKPIGLAYIKPNYSVPNTKIFVTIRAKAHRALVAKTPFFRKDP